MVGVALAIIAGLIPQLRTETITWILVALGLIVGLWNVTAHETEEFLVATVTLIISASVASQVVALGVTLTAILSNIVVFVFPAALIVALKTIWSLAQN